MSKKNCYTNHKRVAEVLAVRYCNAKLQHMQFYYQAFMYLYSHTLQTAKTVLEHKYYILCDLVLQSI
jgi:hypothetical protein